MEGKRHCSLLCVTSFLPGFSFALGNELVFSLLILGFLVLFFLFFLLLQKCFYGFFFPSLRITLYIFLIFFSSQYVTHSCSFLVTCTILIMLFSNLLRVLNSTTTTMLCFLPVFFTWGVYFYICDTVSIRSSAYFELDCAPQTT